ncbi:MAG: hypothetical protein WCI27_09965, partial [Candidatus Omnitrophota bacterium]
AEGVSDRLSRQSEKECLKVNQGLGLVEAMRVCQKSVQPFDAITGAGGISLADGRRRIHVLAQALERLGLDKKRIQQVIEITGDQVLSDDSYEEVFPARTFIQKFDQCAQDKLHRWRDALEKFRSSGRGTAAALEELSWPGVPVTSGVLAGLDLLEDAPQGIAILKLADAGAFAEVDALYRQANEYLGYCLLDPVLSSAFRRIIHDKKEALERARMAARSVRTDALIYKELIASLAEQSDTARAAMARRTATATGIKISAEAKEMMLNF